ncbi:hypothetical protein V6N13_010157 [Hibiscus sabdariffa]
MPINCFFFLDDQKGSLDSLQAGQSSRVRSFPHVEGNYALHVYIPVLFLFVLYSTVLLFDGSEASYIIGLGTRGH